MNSNLTKFKSQISSQDIIENKWRAVLSYLGIFVLIPLFWHKNSKFVQSHAKQGLVLFIAEIIATFVNIVPMLGQLIWVLASIYFIAISVCGIIKVLRGKVWQVPYFGKYAKKIKLD